MDINEFYEFIQVEEVFIAEFLIIEQKNWTRNKEKNYLIILIKMKL